MREKSKIGCILIVGEEQSNPKSDATTSQYLSMVQPGQCLLRPFFRVRDFSLSLQQLSLGPAP